MKSGAVLKITLASSSDTGISSAASATDQGLGGSAKVGHTLNRLECSFCKLPGEYMECKCISGLAEALYFYWGWKGALIFSTMDRDPFAI